MPDHQQRPPDRTVTEYEDQKGGKSPRPATEPSGSKSASRTNKTQTDPATGEDMGDAKGSEKV